MQRRLQEMVGVLRGTEKVFKGFVSLQVAEASWWWRNSSVGQDLIKSFTSNVRELSQLDVHRYTLFVLDRTQLFGLQCIILTNRLLSDFLLQRQPKVQSQNNLFTSGLHTSDILYSNPVEPKQSFTSLSRSPIDTNNTSNPRHSNVITSPLPLSEFEATGVEITSRKLDLAKERRVPSSRIGRMAGFGNLAVGLSVGAAAEWTKRKVGYMSSTSETQNFSNLFLTEANLERIVDTLCRMRGAALKLGQMLSIQDDSLVSQNVQKIFERVRQAADFMPTRQMQKVLSQELGPNWSSLVSSFEERPFAAASIGQVHRAVLLDGRRVAMKIQYPGVVDSIDADINNLMSLLKRLNIFPRGLFADRAVQVAKRELRNECDYRREAAYCKRFAALLAEDSVFQVPGIIDELTTGRVLTAEYMEGLVLDDCFTLSQDVRNWIGGQLLRLCLKELFVFHVMQTDPNWSNFLYNPTNGKIILLDFGASREYDKKFVDVYIRLIHCAAERDRDGIVQHSRTLGFLTGYESKIMVQAHVDAVSILGEAFSANEPFDFGHQSTTGRINRIIPVMLEHRLAPPPDESYSLHRKMSGCFLLCGKLKAIVDCRPLFYSIWDNYVFDQSDNVIRDLLKQQ